ncbi:MAG: AI-2E family transporter [Geminicoccaceae bacterium]
MSPYDNARFFERAIALAIMALLFMACFQIIRPFLGALLWGIVIAVSTWGPYVRLVGLMNGRRKLAAAVMSIVLFLILVIPVSLLVGSAADGVRAVAELLRELSTVVLPEPPDWIAKVPIVGRNLDAYWRAAVIDMPAQLSPYIGTAASYGLSWGAALGGTVLEFMIAVIVAGFLYVTGEAGVENLDRFLSKIGSDKHAEVIEVVGRTIRGVANGVIGTAFIQGVLAGAGYVVVGAPSPIMLSFLTFFVAVLQIPSAIIWVPVGVWLLAKDSTGLGVFMLVWGSVVVGLVDNFVRPVLISQGAKLPLILIFVGVLGGLLAYGFIGIFLGAVILAVCYKVLTTWLRQEPGDIARVP